MNAARLLVLVFVASLLASVADAQPYQLKTGNHNNLFIPPASVPAGDNEATFPATPDSNFQGMGAAAGSVGPISTSNLHAERFPSNPSKTITLVRNTVGGVFISGAPRYFLGDEITPPLTNIDGVPLAGATEEARLAAARLYWRPQPVLPGENIPGMGVVIPAGQVTVISASENSTTVIVAAPVPDQLLLGATLLGEPIARITGTDTLSVTLAGNANETITTPSPRLVTPAAPFYYSKHANKVYASEPGQVTIDWVTANLTQRRTESFVVSGTTQRPVRTIYWTKGSFDGPPVQITDARITTVNMVYNRTVPKAVPQEVRIPSYIPVIPDLSTLSFSKFNGLGSLHAYNLEGRLLIEYLGNVRLGDAHESLGIDVVEIKREPQVYFAAPHLGTELRPRTPTQDGDNQLHASPVLRNAQAQGNYYGTIARPDGTLAYFAERETSAANRPDNGEPASSDAYNQVVFYWLESPPDNFGIRWPKFQTRYWQRWSPNLADYAHYTVDTGGSTPATGISFAGGTLPTIVWQDDPAQTEARINLATQSLFVDFAPTNPNLRNRSLLKFSSSGEIWYVNLYTQAESRRTTRPLDADGTDLVTLTGGQTTAGLEVGMIVSVGLNQAGTRRIVGIPDSTHLVLSSPLSTDDTYTFTVEADSGPPINATNAVGARLPAPAGHEAAGFISGGTGYYPAGYLNPFVVGVEAANLGAIIPVNARPNDRVLTVRWFRKIPAPSDEFQSFHVPGKIGRYTVSYPVPGPANPRIVIAESVGTGNLPPAEAQGSIYVQNDAAKPGYNPNEEHSLILGGRAYALREDLNVTAGARYTSEPYLLLAYTDPDDGRPAIRAYPVVREIDLNNDRVVDPGDILFDYTATAGTLLVKPYPLPLMPLPMVGAGINRRSKDLEIVGTDDPANGTVAGHEAYTGFTFEDRKGFTWVHRGAHSGGTPGVFRSSGDGTTIVAVESTAGLALGMSVSGAGLSATATIARLIDVTRYELSEPLAPGVHSLTYGPTLSMKLYYLSRPGFFLPGSGELADGTVLPFLRHPTRSGQPLNINAIDAKPDGTPDQIDEPLTVIYRPAWPVNAAELRVGETLTLPKFDLPQVRGQASAEVYYQQSLANAATNTALAKTSVTLHDPTRQKTLTLGSNGVALEKLPSVIRTSSHQGKTYFQLLPPHLQRRFWHDPLDGLNGTLYFVGEFHHGPDEGFSGDDYLDLNLLSATDEAALKDLVPVGSDGKGDWDEAIDLLKTSVETFVPDPARLGSYKVNPLASEDVFATSDDGKRNPLAVITDADTAVDSYAVTATGQGSGFVTMVFGNGGNPDQQPPGDPVQVKVFRVAEQLYTGDLKVRLSSNPLDEQVTLRHSGDFAGNPEDYEFDWRWTFGAASEPATYTETMVKVLGDPLASTNQWQVVSDPGNFRPTAAQYAASPAQPLNSRNVNPVTGIFTSQGELVSLPATKVTVPPTPGLIVGMVVTGGSISGTATITSIIERDADDRVRSFVLSQVIPSGTSTLIYNGSLPLSSSSAPLLSVVDEARSYTAAEKAAGYPALVARSTAGLDFSPASHPLGVPERIVLSARLGTLDGFVLYVNGRVALAHNAPNPPFTLSNARTGLTNLGNPDQPGGDASLRQFNLAPGYFNAGPNLIEVALYSEADPNAVSDLDFIIEAASETDNVVLVGSPWQVANDPTGINTNHAIVGGSPLNPFGGPQFVLNDRWFTVRYRPKLGTGGILTEGAVSQDDIAWSRWSPPQFVEGWVKRVLAAINPFEQRVKDLFNNAVNTDVSLLTQAGRRWEGDIALTMDNINDVGLIEIYETVLNRARNMSINANTNDPDSNNALLLAAGYLNDLYTILGNEAWADAANPTISIDDPSSVFEVNTSRFAFEGQVVSSLDEELALLRGRDDFVSPGVATAPVYNRLIWNYTRGINSGEVIYAVNYNIKEKAGSTTADGVVDESDAQRMFPQGHGDAYGHYLTALTGYYRLLSNPNFDWQARAEAVTVNGRPVTVDFQDERKFAAAAGNLARTAEQIAALTYRKSYVDDPAAGWSSSRDTRGPNQQTGVIPEQGLDEWVSRASQGSYYHWVVGNALVPDVDTFHTGVQKIDRTTVPELPQLAAAAASLQTTIDNANAHLNPLGLSPGAIAFDIDPSFIEVGSTAQVGTRPVQGLGHFGQIYERALRALNNAAGAFNQAASMTRSLRDQTNELDDFNSTIVQQEVAYMNQLIDIYGRPYSGDIGPGRLYAQGYAGPDFHHWFIVDRPTDLTDTGKTFTISLMEANQVAYYTGDNLRDISDAFFHDSGKRDAEGNPVPPRLESTFRESTVTIRPSQWVQYADVWKPDGLGSRPMTGELQEALQDAQETWMDLYELNVVWQRQTAQLEHLGRVFKDLLRTHIAAKAATGSHQAEIRRLEALARDLDIATDAIDRAGDIAIPIADAVAEYFPSTIFDVTSSARAVAKTVGTTAATIASASAIATRTAGAFQQSNILAQEHLLEQTLQELDFSHEEVQLAYEWQLIYVETVTGATELMQLMVPHQRALQRVNNVLAKGIRIQAERDVFRQRAAALIQGYRTRDLSFRVFRNESLEQYRSLFDLASRYTYLTAKVYDYETGLLGSPQGQAVFNRIVASRSLGDLTGSLPQSTTSSLGDGGLAGVMAQIDADFSVAIGRLGINNPDYYDTVFSLRRELFRLLDDPAITSDDDAWRQTLEQRIVPDLLNDADVATHCRHIAKSDGSPVPGIIIEFGTTIQQGKNFFGLPLAAFDHVYSASSFGTKINSAGIVFRNYVGMDPSIGGVAPNAENSANAMSGNPYVYLIPCGIDYMRAPLSGTEEVIRSWRVQDAAIPLPYNLGASAFNSTQFFNANGTLSEQPWVIRKHQAFRAVGNEELFYGGAPPREFSNSRLIARSAWNSRWKIVIPAYSLLNNEQEGLNRFVAGVTDIMLYLRTYSHSGN